MRVIIDLSLGIPADSKYYRRRTALIREVSELNTQHNYIPSKLPRKELQKQFNEMLNKIEKDIHDFRNQLIPKSTSPS